MRKSIGQVYTSWRQCVRQCFYKLRNPNIVPSLLQQQIKGPVGLFFTDSEPDEVLDWFADFHPPDFARTGNVSTRTIVLPAGPVLQHHSDPPEPFPHNEEPQLRKLGLHTTLKRGVPTLDNPQTVCEKGKKLSSEQSQLLKLLGEKLVEFQVVLRARWSADDGDVTQIEGQELSGANGADGDEDEGDLDD
jgi:mRNA turnover protein 4